MNIRTLAFIFLSLTQLLSVSFAEGTDSAKKAELSKQFKSFISENQNLRSDHEKKVYNLQKDFLEENYKRQQDLLAKLKALENNLEFGEQDKNKEIRTEIKKTFKEFRSQMRERRQDFFKDTLKAEKKSFKEQMKKRHKTLKNELKAEIGPISKGHEGKGKGKHGRRMRDGKNAQESQMGPDGEHAHEDHDENE